MKHSSLNVFVKTTDNCLPINKGKIILFSMKLINSVIRYGENAKLQLCYRCRSPHNKSDKKYLNFGEDKTRIKINN